MQQYLDQWHHVVEARDFDFLNDLLADDVEFLSPVVFTPKRGKDVTRFILVNVLDIIENFTYHREFMKGDDVALEFSGHVGDIQIKGIDLIHFNEAGKIDHFEVLLRPAKALEAVGAAMGARLQNMGPRSE